jgi:predicted ATP-grasp superfamily ATP-dependent carboligase
METPESENMSPGRPHGEGCQCLGCIRAKAANASEELRQEARELLESPYIREYPDKVAVLEAIAGGGETSNVNI